MLLAGKNDDDLSSVMQSWINDNPFVSFILIIQPSRIIPVTAYEHPRILGWQTFITICPWGICNVLQTCNSMGWMLFRFLFWFCVVYVRTHPYVVCVLRVISPAIVICYLDHFSKMNNCIEIQPGLDSSVLKHCTTYQNYHYPLKFTLALVTLHG